MLMARKDNFEEDVLANFRLKALYSGQNIPIDKYEGNDIYEDKTDKKRKDNISNNKEKVIQSPKKKSPYKSPKKNIILNNINIQSKSPKKSPLGSPKRVIINLDDNDKNKAVKSEDDLTIDNDDDSIIEIEENEEDDKNKDI